MVGRQIGRCVVDSRAPRRVIRTSTSSARLLIDNVDKLLRSSAQRRRKVFAIQPYNLRDNAINVWNGLVNSSEFVGWAGGSVSDVSDGAVSRLKDSRDSQHLSSRRSARSASSQAYPSLIRLNLTGVSLRFTKPVKEKISLDVIVDDKACRTYSFERNKKDQTLSWSPEKLYVLIFDYVCKK